MRQSYKKVLFVVLLAVFIIAAGIDIKNSGILVTGGYVMAPVRAGDGTAAAPSHSFSSAGSSDNGMYLSGADAPAIAAGGNAIGIFSATGLSLGALDLTCNQGTFNGPGIAATPTDGAVLENATLATNAIRAQFSPSVRLRGHAWDINSAEDNSLDIIIDNQPLEGNDPYAIFSVFGKRGNAAATQLMSLGYGSGNLLIGQLTGNPRTMTGASNVGIGTFANAGLTSGGTNMAIGYGSLQVNQSGSSNTAIGYYALNSMTGGSSVGIGSMAGRYDTAAQSVYIDNLDRTAIATGKSNSLIYGVANAVTTGLLQFISLGGVVIKQNSALYGGGERSTVKTLSTTDATATNIWENTNTITVTTNAVPVAVTALVDGSCVNVRARCTAVNKADVDDRNSYDKESLCCRKGSTTTCDAVTAIREVETSAAWDMTIIPCDTVAGACTTADAPGVQITGEAAHNVNWKCVIDSFVTDNT